ncbi:MAG: hypothetical protein HY815_02915 [Candidatus Riflebacteria bacterium]|nr:hypothetical protein [Candidatus Riflebacteria bacterium]
MHGEASGCCGHESKTGGEPTDRAATSSASADLGPPFKWLSWLWVLSLCFAIGGCLRGSAPHQQHLIGNDLFGVLFGILLAVLFLFSTELFIHQAIVCSRRTAPWTTWAVRVLGLTVVVWLLFQGFNELVDISDGWEWIEPCGHVQFGRPSRAGTISGLVGLTWILILIGWFRDEDRRPSRACASFLVIVTFGSAIGGTGFAAARERACTRACYANQKTIAGAIEMYELDKNTRRTVLDRAFFETLKSERYLQSITTDPGFGSRSTRHYGITTGPGRVRCALHGEIQ